MKNSMLPSNAVENKAMRNIKMMKRAIRISAIGAVFAASAFLPFPNPQAQKKDAPNVTGISSRKTARGQVITITTDGPVSGTQTWQDPNGKFNLVLPGSGASQVSGAPGGVAVRKLGNSLGIEVPTKPGANVTVQPRANGVDLIVEGEVESPKSAAQSEASGSSNGTRTRTSTLNVPDVARPYSPPPATSSISQSSAPSTTTAAPATATAQPQANNPATTPASQPATTAGNSAATTPAAPAQPPAAAPTETTEEGGGLTSYIFSYTGLAVLLLVGLVVVLVLRRRQDGGWENVEDTSVEKNKKAVASAPVSVLDEETERTGERRKRARRKGSWGGRRVTDQPEALVKSSGVGQMIEGRETAMETRQNVLVPSSLFGEYRVDQEIGKLLLGQPHRIDVLASRAPDDRRAMETSLLKALDSPDCDEAMRRRAREALEDYGYVARQSAALLLSQDAYERASAARILGEVQSASSLPFLLEALYDSEQIVRSQAVTSIGALKRPAAIGALLDMARRYPDMPANLISRALSDCSVESLNFMEGMPQGQLLLNSGEDGMFTGEITQLEPATDFEALPEWLEDENLAEALERLASTDVEARTAAATSLAQYQVQRSVDALTVLASRDTEASVRAAAVTSLGVIDHESVFAPVLMAFADDAREVRAAAARALSRLNFNRADAYVRLIDCADAETLTSVAQACVHAGMAKQAVDRLASEDRRQAYEAFTLLSLLVRAGENEPILEAIRSHRSDDVRLAAIKVLGIFGRPEVLQNLRELAVTDGIPETVRMALMEVVYKIDQATNQPEDYSAVTIDPV
ncbi:MAG: HEAT repeat domain-containing protein [Pyrinomonadaceae bacterium]|nr:HEAT repeat domain-containing protein [Pyrinomonadaceae bacterium]